jgi:hypothetical protein
MDMLWELLQWFISLVEVIGVLAVILVAGVMIAMGAFWILARSLGKLTVEPDPDESEMDGCLAVEFENADNVSVPAEPGIEQSC